MFLPVLRLRPLIVPVRFVLLPTLWRREIGSTFRVVAHANTGKTVLLPFSAPLPLHARVPLLSGSRNMAGKVVFGPILPIAA